MTESILLNLSSTQSTLKNGSFKSNVSFEFNGLLKDEKSITYCEISLSSIQIPYIFYTINYSNNRLDYTFLFVNYSITLNTGFYNANTLIAELISQFQSNGHTFSINLNQSNGRLTFQSNRSFSFLGSSTCLVILGFSETINSSGNDLEMPYPCNLLGITKLKILSTELITNNSSGNLLQTIPVNVANYGLLCWENSPSHFSTLKSRTINSIDILIQDQYGNLVNMNNQDWEMTIILKIYRDYNLRYNLEEIINTQNENFFSGNSL